MNFAEWLNEILEPTQTIPPDERFKNIFVNDPNNPQQVATWQRKETKQIYRFPLNKEWFIHFSLVETISQIIKYGEELTGPVYAISRSFGKWVPGVQYDHIISRKPNTMSPSKLRDPMKRAKYEKAGWAVPNFGEAISAITFQTNIPPTSAHPEEVYWEVDHLPVQGAKALSSRMAINMLKNVPYQIGNNDQVTYY